MEILACPHCERLFQTTPRVLGKKIRCRGCGGLFHIPKDTASVPLSPTGQPGDAELNDPGPPIAIACVVDGQEARRCPSCSRTFSMKPAFMGKVIRCRGCRVSFRVAPVESSPSESAVEQRSHANGKAAHDGVSSELQHPGSSEAAAIPQSTIFEDIGDVIDDVLAGEQAPSVVRPRNIPTRSGSAGSAVMNLIGMVMGGVVALPVTQMILWWGFRRDPLGVALMLPEAIRWIAPDQLGR